MKSRRTLLTQYLSQVLISTTTISWHDNETHTCMKVATVNPVLILEIKFGHYGRVSEYKAGYVITSTATYLLGQKEHLTIGNIIKNSNFDTPESIYAIIYQWILTNHPYITKEGQNRV